LLLNDHLNGSLIICMLHRAKMICSSDSLFFREVINLKSLFITNNYPANFSDKILRKFLHSFSTQSQQDDDNTDNSDKCNVKVPMLVLHLKYL